MCKLTYDHETIDNVANNGPIEPILHSDWFRLSIGHLLEAGRLRRWKSVDWYISPAVTSSVHFNVLEGHNNFPGNAGEPVTGYLERLQGHYQGRYRAVTG